MDRRNFVRAMMTVSIAPKLLLAQQTANPAPPPAAPVPWTLGLNPATPLPHTEVVDVIADSDLTFFSTEQMATLNRLCDLLLPALGNKPGALGAGAPAFLDFLLASSPPARRELYTSGLAWLNDESKSKFGASFALANAAQADALVKPWLRTWMTDHPPSEAHADFLNIAHADIRTATTNSKAWSEVAEAHLEEAPKPGLYWSPIEPDIYAESFNSVHVRPSPIMDAPRSSHMTPSYPQ